MATAIQTLVVSVTLASSGLNSVVIKPVTDAINEGIANENELTNTEIREMIAGLTTPEMLLDLRVSMLAIPLALIVLSYAVYHYRYKIDDKMYDQITKELLVRIDEEEKRRI